MNARSTGHVTLISQLTTNSLQQQTNMIHTVVMATPHQRRHAVVVMDVDVNTVA